MQEYFYYSVGKNTPLNFSTFYFNIWKVENAKTNIVLDPRGLILNGEHSLLARNCTAMIIVSLNDSAKNIHIPVMVSPAELRSYLNTRYDAEKSNKIQLET